MGRRARPLIGILCCNEDVDRPVQTVASRFVRPLADLADANVLLVPALPEAVDADALAAILDGLLLTGSRSHVAPSHYGGPALADDARSDPGRDAVALTLADRMIEAGKPVFGICRGLQEINVLFGGSLAPTTRHHAGSWDGDYAALFGHGHDVDLARAGCLADATGATRLRVNSVHQQGIDRLGGGLSVEATGADDGLVEAVSASPCGGAVLGVQWHPEWDVARSPASRAFFTLLGATVRGAPFHHGEKKMKFRIALPLVAAAALGLSACHKQDVANNSAAADETLTLNDEGVADNNYDAIGAGNLDAPADNALTPVDGAPTAGNGATGNAL